MKKNEYLDIDGIIINNQTTSNVNESMQRNDSKRSMNGFNRASD